MTRANNNYKEYEQGSDENMFWNHRMTETQLNCANCGDEEFN